MQYIRISRSRPSSRPLPFHQRLLLIAFLFLCATAGFGQTVNLNESQVVNSAPYKTGINIGSVANYGNGQIYKNLLATVNAGFEPLQTQQIWTQTVPGTTTTFTTTNIYPTVAANRFAGATYTIVASSTKALGCTGAITSSTAGAYPAAVQFTLGSPCAVATGVGDTMIVKLNETPTAEAQWESSNNGVWTGQGGAVTAGGGRILSDTTTPYDGVQSIILDTTTPSSPTTPAQAGIGLPFDALVANTENSIVLNGSYTMSVAAKLLSGTASLTFTVARPGGVNCSNTIHLTNSWQNYSFTCNATETNTVSPSTAWAFLQVSGSGRVDVDEAQFFKNGGLGANTSVFRDEVYSTLLAYCGGTSGPTCPIRNWSNQDGENLDNWIAAPQSNSVQALSALQTVASTGMVYGGLPTPRLQEYLKLVQLVHGVPYLEVPVTFTTTDAANLIEFLESTNSASGYGLKRAQLGQSSPWVGSTGVFPEIYLTFCNECWNPGNNNPDNMPYRASAPTYYYDYARRAGQIYAAMRKDASFNPTATHLGFDMQLGNSYLLSTDISSMAAAGGAPDYIEQAPYTQYVVSNWQTDTALWGSAMEEPYGNAADPASGSNYYQGVAAIKAIASCGQSGNAPCVPTDYEQANSTVITCGFNSIPTCTGGGKSIDQTHEDFITAGAGEGIIAPLQSLLSAQLLGVQMQNYFALTQFNQNPLPDLGGLQPKLWGNVVDMGGSLSYLDGAAYRPRPQFLGLSAANQAMIGPMYSCPISNGPTYNWPGDPLNGPTHALSNVPYLYAFCFKSLSGPTRSMALFNTDLANSHAVTFAGTSPPNASSILSVTQLAPASLDLMNEAPTGTLTNQVPITVRSMSGSFSGTFSLAPHSMYVLTWTSGGPAISNVLATNVSSTSASLTWTTDQPSTSLVNYGTTAAYGSSSTVNSNLVTSHSVTLTGLKAGTTYDFAVVSANSSGVSTSSSNYTFLTSGAPVISGVSVSGVTSSSATINWTTDQATSSLVNYGTTTAYGSSSALNSSLVTSHSVTLTGLAANTTYNFDVVSANSAGASATSPNSTFTTSAVPTPPALLAYEPFGEASGTPLNGATGNGDSGWASPWVEQLGSNVVPGYEVLSANPLTYVGLQTTPNYAIGGYQYQSAGRQLNVTPGGPFNSYLSNGLIGTPGQTIWLSFLLREDANPSNGQINAVYLTANNSGSSWQPQLGIGIGYFGGTASWGLQYNNGTPILSNVPVVQGQPTLFVVQITFGSTNQVNLYVNPVIGGAVPTTPSASFSQTGSVAFQSIAYLGTYGASQSSLGSIRVGTSFAAVTPSRTPVISGVSVSGVSSSSVTINWTTDQATSSLVNYGTTTVYGSSSGLNSSLVTSHSVTLIGLAASTAYNFDVVSANLAGTSTTSPNSRFTTSAITPPPALLAFEPFGESSGTPLNGATGNGDSGWAAPWVEQLGSNVVPGYEVLSANPLTYAGLQTTPNYAIGGYQYQSAGRQFNVTPAGPFASYLANGLIGASGQTVWLSFLLREDANPANGQINALYLSNYGAGNSWVPQVGIGVGYFGDTPSWGLQLNNGTPTLSTVSVVQGQPTLLVVSVTFGTTNLVNLYVNPTSLGGSAPTTPSATFSTTSNIAFQSVSYLGGYGTNSSSLADLRVGTTYASVTP